MSENRNRPRTCWFVPLLAVTVALLAIAAPASGRSVAGLPEQIINSLGPRGLDPSGQPIASGRIQDVEADPFDPSGQRLLALSDAALWESTNGGGQWHRLQGLEHFAQWNFSTSTLAFDPVEPGVVLIASRSDDRQPTERGIYRSTDGGLTWSQPTGYQAACPGGGVGDPTVVTFQGHTAYAAAGCVVGRSLDDGATWTWTAPDPAGGFYGVTVDPAGNAYACGANGVYERLLTGPWRRAIDFTLSPWALGVPSGTSCRMTSVAHHHIFFTARWSGLTPDPNSPTAAFSAVFEAYVDGNGWHWQDLMGPAHPNGRDVVVQTRADPSGGFELYWNSTDLWYYQRCTVGSGFYCSAGSTIQEDVPDPPWIRFDYSGNLHADAGNILFSTTFPFCVRMVADDGGIQVPGRDNCSGAGPDWSYSNAGIQALQPWDIAVTSIVATTTSDVYAASQDNGGYALLPGEHGGWRQPVTGNDGLAVGATARLTPSTLGTGRVFYNGNGAQYLAHRGFEDVGVATGTPFQPPWSGLFASQQVGQLPDGRLVVAVCPGKPLQGCSKPAAALFTSSDGSSWSRLGTTNLSLKGRSGGEGGVSVLAASATGPPVLFVRVLGDLYRVDGKGLTQERLLPGTDVGPYAAGGGRHLIVFACPSTGGCSAGAVMASDDGGRTWRTLDVITRLVTSDGFGGDYPLDNGDADSGQVTSVAISPTNPAILAVGTRDTGLFDSADGGRSWERLPFVAPYLWHLRFSDDGRLIVGSFGRGLYVVWPTPSQLQLNVQLASPTTLRYAARARSSASAFRAGGPIQGLRLEFKVLAPDGSRTSVGTSTTNAEGFAYITLNRPPGAGYTLLAHWSGPGNAELETQAPMPAAMTIHP